VVVPIFAEQALILRRAHHLKFQPGFHSFPGGVIEAADDRPAGPGPGPRDARLAALREMVEEVGLIPPHDSPQSDEQIRRDFNSGKHDQAWGELVRCCDWSRWRYLGVWTTPEYAQQRFETHFFSCQFDAPVPPDSNSEVAHAWWIEREEAHASWRSGALPASPPVLAALDAAFDGATVFFKPGTERDLLCAGGALRYLPLRAPTLPPAAHTNCCLIGGGGVLYAVDPAPVDPDERELLWAHLEALKGQGDVLRGVVLTHLHHDHLGAACWLSERAKVPVYASARTAADLEHGLGSGLSAGGFASQQLPRVTEFLRDGDMLEGGWQVLETPGHAHGHLCLWHASSRSLVAGDMIASGSTILIEPEQGDLKAYLESLDRLAKLNPALVVPAHGMPLALGQEAFRALIAHRLMREEKTHQALQVLGSGSAQDLLPLAYADTPEFLWPLAELSLISHLNKLVVDGRVSQAGPGRWRVDGDLPSA
jgi:glyoxylase-like metal-dependent hydrolase (beta-lactamase superfamily II)